MEMTDYVSYDLALKLKACGFDEPCDHYYARKGIIGDSFRLYDAYSGMKHQNSKYSTASAPTLWLAQKWLREKKELYVNCFWNAKGQHWQPHCQWMNEVQGEPIGYAESYEGGLSKAITAALELIKKWN